jgi:hypothetical protein
MKIRSLSALLVLTAIVFAFVHTGYAQDQFEGKVTFNVYDDGESHTVEYFVKDNKIRFDANEEGQQGQIVMDPSAKQVMIIMPQQKMYMVMPIPDTNMDSDNSGKMDDDTKFVKTGETKEILGYTAEKWTYKDGNDVGEAWMTKDVGALRLFNNPMQEDKPDWQKDLEGAGYFPLLVLENGKKVYEVTKVEKKSLDESMFEAPAGFQKMDMPMMQK